LDFEVELSRDLTRIGATVSEAKAYVDGLRRGGALAFATGSEEKVEAAARIMNRRGAVQIETVSGPEPQLPAAIHSWKVMPCLGVTELQSNVCCSAAIPLTKSSRRLVVKYSLDGVDRVTTVTNGATRSNYASINYSTSPSNTIGTQ